MKVYEQPSVDVLFFAEYDVITMSIGTSNDNDFGDEGNWG